MTEPRLKLPAYAKALLDNRRRGFHPLRVSVYFGDDWAEAAARVKRERALFVRQGLAAVPYGAEWLRVVGEPMLAIRPREFAPGAFDWRSVVGTVVTVIDGCGALADWDMGEDGRTVTRWGLFYYLLGDVSRLAAEVLYRAGVKSDQDGYAADLAMSNRRFDREAGAMVWPQWWPDDDKTRVDRERRKSVWWGAESKRAGVAA